ncbi:MAG TPA: hypothetical protein VIJ38_01460 [Acidobacteriaceae bacterium]
MSELVGVALSIVSTLTLQGAYFVLLKYPDKVSQEKLTLETRQQEMMEQMADRDASLDLLQKTTVELRTFSDGLCMGVAPADVPGLLMGLQMIQAQLRGLEVFDQPRASNVEKTAAAVGRAVELAQGWDGAPNPVAAVEFSLVVQTLLYSSMAVKRANDSSLTAFWMQMRERQVALKSLVQTFLASAIVLEFVSILFLGLGFRWLATQGLMPRWGAWSGWVVMSAIVILGMHRMLRFIWPVNALVQSIGEQSAAALQRSAPLVPGGAVPAGAEKQAVVAPAGATGQDKETTGA